MNTIEESEISFIVDSPVRTYDAYILPRDENYAPPDDQFDSEIDSTLRSLPHLTRQLTEYHTGDPRGDLTDEDEKRLFPVLQAGIQARQEVAEIDKAILDSPDRKLSALLERRRTARAAVKLGEQAMQTVVEVNVRFAFFMARASVGMAPVYRTRTINKIRQARRNLATGQPIDDDTILDLIALNDKGYIGAYGDIADLASPYAELDDRRQNAVVGLIKAALKFKPGYIPPKNPDRKPAKFVTYATWDIHQQLDRSVAAGHGELMEACGPRLPYHVREEIRGKFREYEIDDLSTVAHQCTGKGCAGCAEKRHLEQLQQWDIASRHISLSDVSLPHAAEEEVWDPDWDEPPVLTVADVWADPQPLRAAAELVHKKRADAIEEVLTNTLDEREAAIVRKIAGIGEDRPQTYDEVGPSYEISGTRVGQIYNRALRKLRDLDDQPLKGLLGLGESEAASPEMHGDDRLRTGRVVLRKVVSKDYVKTDTPVAAVGRPEKGSVEYDEVFGAFLSHLTEEIYHYRKSVNRFGKEQYPAKLYKKIDQDLGQRLTPQHIEEFWNEWLPGLVAQFRGELAPFPGEDNFDYSSISSLVSALLATRMQDKDYVRLRIPENMDGKFNYLGGWATHGEIAIIGDAGHGVGFRMSQRAVVTVRGDVGNYAGAEASGHSRLHIYGSASDCLGQGAAGDVAITVGGAAGDYAARGAKERAQISIGKSAGRQCASYITSPSVTVRVGENAGPQFAHRSTTGSIVVGNTALLFDAPKR